MFKFTVKSPIVQIYVAQVLAGSLTIENVPTFFGLRDAVKEVLASLGAEIIE